MLFHCLTICFEKLKRKAKKDHGNSTDIDQTCIIAPLNSNIFKTYQYLDTDVQKPTSQYPSLVIVIVHLRTIVSPALVQPENLYVPSSRGSLFSSLALGACRTTNMRIQVTQWCRSKPTVQVNPDLSTVSIILIYSAYL